MTEKTQDAPYAAWEVLKFFMSYPNTCTKFEAMTKDKYPDIVEYIPNGMYEIETTVTYRKIVPTVTIHTAFEALKAGKKITCYYGKEGNCFMRLLPNESDNRMIPVDALLYGKWYIDEQ